MRKRRSAEEVLAQPDPVMYSRANLYLMDGLRSSFPSWRRASQFDYRNGWTKMGDFFADGYFTRDEMRELVHTRFGVLVR
jgi:hypothetical protein